MKVFWTAGLMAIALVQAADAQGVIRLKTGNISPAPSRNVARRKPAPEAVRHFLVEFQTYPDAGVRAQLADRRIQVLAYVPDNTLMVSTTAPPNLRGLDVAWSGPLDAEQKLSPLLASQPASAYVVVFEPDTNLTDDAQLAQSEGFTIIQNPNLLAAQLLVAGPASALQTLAGSDDVAYILPASADLEAGVPVMGCAGAVTEAGPVPEYAQPLAQWSPASGGGITLGYHFDQLTGKLDTAQVESEIARAFAEWARYTNVSFTPAAETEVARSIDVLFARGAHGDAYPFDGSGGVLAHTFFPAPPNSEPIAGDMHFDDDENWQIGSTVDLFSVALHETGHALGLGHSDQPGDVMYPYYRQTTGLAAGDIAAIRAVYGTTPGDVMPPAGGTPGGGSGAGSGSGSGGGGSGTTGSGSGGTGSKSETVPPSLTILSPNSTIAAAYSSMIVISGSASDNVGVVSVTWSTSNGDAGTASGTTFWSAAVPLLIGNNTVTARAYDAAGNSCWRTVMVVRQ